MHEPFHRGTDEVDDLEADARGGQRCSRDQQDERSRGWVVLGYAEQPQLRRTRWLWLAPVVVIAGTRIQSKALHAGRHQWAALLDERMRYQLPVGLTRRPIASLRASSSASTSAAAHTRLRVPADKISRMPTPVSRARARYVLASVVPVSRWAVSALKIGTSSRPSRSVSSAEPDRGRAIERQCSGNSARRAADSSAR